MKKFLCLLLFFSSMAFGKEKVSSSYFLMLDPFLSPYAGGETLITIHHLLENTQDILLDNNHPKKEWLTRIGRAIQLTFIWNPINDAAMITEHEVFGHGYRLRDIGHKHVDDLEYEIYPSMLWFQGEGATLFTQEKPLTSSLMCAIAAAGIEASSILAHQIKTKWLSHKKTNAKNATLYFSAFQDLTIYSLVSSKLKMHDYDSDDIHSYVFWLKNTYHNSSYNVRKLRNLALINLLDPCTYYALYGWLKYIWSGKEFSFPKIQIHQYSYLPNLHVGLAPFGPEVFIENYLQYQQQLPIYFYIKVGSFADNIYGGLGIEYRDLLLTKKGMWGLRFDSWLQPKVLFKQGKKITDSVSYDYDHKSTKTQRFGLGLSVIYEHFVTSMANSVFIQAGYKTKGFLPGESLKQAIIARVGIGLNF